MPSDELHSFTQSRSRAALQVADELRSRPSELTDVNDRQRIVACGKHIIEEAEGIVKELSKSITEPGEEQ
ncbi:MAG TPA: hypothetical protein VHB51_03650 [Candidatus Saccharimonadales bacterium]|nr:hypothetical protein [Candidatus Saccharimonadales bacterium]